MMNNGIDDSMQMIKEMDMVSSNMFNSIFLYN